MPAPGEDFIGLLNACSRVMKTLRRPALVELARTEAGIPVERPALQILGVIRKADHALSVTEIADACHELRTPLAAIRGYAELSRRGQQQVPADVAYAMRRVESETARMTTLVDDLLLLARLDSGRPLAREPVDLSRLVVDALSDAHVAGPEHSWTLDAPEDPVVVPGDSERLHQVLANLLANARTHTPAGTGVKVALTKPNGIVELTVADDGPGIPEQLRSEVFERFARADSSRSRTAGGTGLGLAIVSAVVEAHHGTVDVDSRPGQTVFTVRLPTTC